MAKKQKVKLNYKNIIIAVIIVIILVFGGILAINLLGTSEGTGTPVIEHETHSDLPYTIRSNATDYQKELYKELETLYAEEAEPIALAESIAKNFVADFFTLSNKTIKNDIGGAQFWCTDIRLEFREKAVDYFYQNLELYIHDFGAENLPTVTSITVNEIEEKQINATDVVYHMTMSWTYDEVEGFPISKMQNTATVEVIEEDEELYMYYFGK